MATKHNTSSRSLKAKTVREPAIALMGLALRLGEVSRIQDKAGKGVQEACEAEITALEELILARQASTLGEAAVQLALVHEDIACHLEPGERFDAKELARRLGRVITSVFAAIHAKR